MRIPDKKTFQSLQAQGLTGNYFRSWSNPVQAVDECATGGFYIRGPVPQWPWMTPWCPKDQLLARIDEIERESKRYWNNLTFVEVLPFGTRRTINAEYAHGSVAGRDLVGYTDYLYWGQSSQHDLRTDLIQNGRESTGLEAQLVLEELVPEEDRQMLNQLVKDYPGSVIEFSTYAMPVGVDRRRTIVWEVRHYAAAFLALGAVAWNSLSGVVGLV